MPNVHDTFGPLARPIATHLTSKSLTNTRLNPNRPHEIRVTTVKAGVTAGRVKNAQRKDSHATPSRHTKKGDSSPFKNRKTGTRVYGK